MNNPEGVLEEFSRAWAARDAVALAELFVEDAEFVNVVGLWWHDRAAIEKAHAYGFDVIFGDSDFSFVSSRSRFVGDSAAVVHGKWKVTGQRTVSGDFAQPRFGIFTFVLGQSDQGWRIVAAQNTDIIPDAESIAVVDGQSTPSDYR